MDPTWFVLTLPPSHEDTFDTVRTRSCDVLPIQSLEHVTGLLVEFDFRSDWCLLNVHDGSVPPS